VSSEHPAANNNTITVTTFMVLSSYGRAMREFWRCRKADQQLGNYDGNRCTFPDGNFGLILSHTTNNTIRKQAYMSVTTEPPQFDRTEV